jgi:hypothetical protein
LNIGTPQKFKQLYAETDQKENEIENYNIKKYSINENSYNNSLQSNANADSIN